MATISVYQTTGGLLSSALENNPYLNYSLGDLLRNDVMHLSSYNSSMAAEYQAGYYNYGVAGDGSFVVETPSFYTNFYGTTTLYGSSINKIIFTDKINGNVLVAEGNFSYQGVPFLSATISASFTKLTETYQISSNLYVQDIMEGNGIISPSGNISGNVTAFSEAVYDSNTNQGGGFIFRGSANYTGSIFNPNSAAVSSGTVTSFGTLLGENFLITDSIIGNGLNWSLSTKLSNVILNAGNDNYAISGTVGTKVDAGTGNDSILGGVGNDSIAGSSGNDQINGGDGLDTVIFSGSRNSYNITKSGNEYIFTDLTSNRDGIDNVSYSEYAQFSDGTFLLNDQFVNSTTIAKVFAPGIYQTARGNTIIADSGYSVGDLIDTYDTLLASTLKNYIVKVGTPSLINYENGEVGIVYENLGKFKEQKFNLNKIATGLPTKLTLDQMFLTEEEGNIDLNHDGYIGNVIKEVVDGNGDVVPNNFGMYKMSSGKYAIGESQSLVGDLLSDDITLMKTSIKAWKLPIGGVIIGAAEKSNGNIEVLLQVGTVIRSQTFDQNTGIFLEKSVLKAEDIISREYYYDQDLNNDSEISLIGQEAPPLGW